jgi:hypothetical protein
VDLPLLLRMWDELVGGAAPDRRTLSELRAAALVNCIPTDVDSPCKYPEAVAILLEGYILKGAFPVANAPTR